MGRVNGHGVVTVSKNDSGRSESTRTEITVAFPLTRILSYKNIKPTKIYTHVSTKSLGKIRSPLDSLSVPKGSDE
jgi:hypothetical protein